MKKLSMFIALLTFACAAGADNYHRGYVRRDGTYVQPHYQSSPNQYRFDNYSSQGNSSPYTGERGSQRNEFSNPPAYNQNYLNPNYNNNPNPSEYRRPGY